MFLFLCLMPKSFLILLLLTFLSGCMPNNNHHTACNAEDMPGNSTSQQLFMPAGNADLIGDDSLANLFAEIKRIEEEMEYLDTMTCEEIARETMALYESKKSLCSYVRDIVKHNRNNGYALYMLVRHNWLFGKAEFDSLLNRFAGTPVKNSRLYDIAKEISSDKILSGEWSAMQFEEGL